MNRRLAAALLGLFLLAAGPARAGWLDELLKRATQMQPTAPATATAALSDEEVVRGLKEALAKGTREAVAQLGREGGFLHNPSVKIPMPEQLKTVEKAARALGQDRLADEFVATMNHAAERAVPEAAAIFSDALAQMTLEDARGILKGPDDAATQYFRKTGSARLAERFRPIVEAATEKAGVTAAYKRLSRQAGPVASLLGADAGDLDAYVTQKALDGLFFMIAAEEKRIRENPAARTTELLKKVFGSLGK